MPTTERPIDKKPLNGVVAEQFTGKVRPPTRFRDTPEEQS